MSNYRDRVASERMLEGLTSLGYSVKLSREGARYDGRLVAEVIHLKHGIGPATGTGNSLDEAVGKLCGDLMTREAASK